MKKLFLKLILSLSFVFLAKPQTGTMADYYCWLKGGDISEMVQCAENSNVNLYSTVISFALCAGYFTYLYFKSKKNVRAQEKRS